MLSLCAATPASADDPPLIPPEITRFVRADYPEAARAAGREAVVGLEILVDANGRSLEVTVVAPAGAGFDEAAVAAAKELEWRAGTVGGTPVAVRVRFDYRFELPPASAPTTGPTTEPARGRAVLAGRVTERGTRAPLGYAEIAVTANGTTVDSATADGDGGFRIAELPAGNFRVTVIATGHQRAEFVEDLVDGEALEVSYRLDPLDASPYRTVVEAERPREEIERRTATRAEATRIPGTRGDALRVVETFPGVARPPFGIGALIVRGANPEDTVTYVAGQPLPLLYHFGGLTSIVNSDLLERIDFLPGNFSARYGRATGGIVSAELRAPRRDRWGGYADISLLDTSLLLEGPVGPGSLAVAARRSYVDAILPLVLSDDADVGLTTAPRYWDYQAIYDVPIGGGQLTVTALGSSDKLELLLKRPADTDPALRGTIGQSTYIQRLIATFKRELGPHTRILASIAQGVTAFKVTAGQVLFIDVLQWFQSYRFEFAHEPLPWLRVVAGMDGVVYPFRVQVKGQRPRAEGEVPTPTSVSEQLVQDSSSWELRHGFYWEAVWQLAKGLVLTTGGRLDYARAVDAWSADLRGTLTWKLGPGVLRAGFGRYSETGPEYQSDAVFGNPRLLPSHALHAQVGYDWQPLSALRIETTLYHKWLTDLAVRSDVLEARSDGTVAPLGYSNEGTGTVIGAELLVRLTGDGPLTGWLSYTLSRSERQDRASEPTRPFSFDQTHILTVVASLRLPWQLLGGMRFRYVTGNPATPITGSVFDADADVYIPIPGATNSLRQDAFHQLDLRIERRFRFDAWMLTVYLDLQNVYNQRNPEGYTYSYDYRTQAVISGLPFFPSLGVKGEF